MAGAGLVQSKDLETVQVSHVAGRGLTTQAVFCCFLMHINRELDQKLGLNWHSDMGCHHLKQWF